MLDLAGDTSRGGAEDAPSGLRRLGARARQAPAGAAEDDEGRRAQVREARPEPALAVRRIEVDVAGRGEEGDSGRARAVGPAEFLRGDVGYRGIEALGPPEETPEVLADAGGSQRMRNRG